MFFFLLQYQTKRNQLPCTFRSTLMNLMGIPYLRHNLELSILNTTAPVWSSGPTVSLLYVMVHSNYTNAWAALCTLLFRARHWRTVSDRLIEVYSNIDHLRFNSLASTSMATEDVSNLILSLFLPLKRRKLNVWRWGSPRYISIVSMLHRLRHFILWLN